MSDERQRASAPRAAGGPRALVESARHALRALGPTDALRVLGELNQEAGFDCPGCAWPDPPDRSFAEFCENGVKHVAHEGTGRRVDARFLAAHPVRELLERDHRWLEEQGRLVEPVVRRRGAERYEPISWDEALARVAAALRALPDPDRAVFYTSGRTSNEAAFLYQLLVRRLGTNNLPDCSNMCHESSGTGLGDAIGVGKGTVGLEDFALADLVLVVGQNPGSNHPRMLATLQEARRRGCGVVSVNPLGELGLERFGHPKELRGLLGLAGPVADQHVAVRVGGDVALFQGIAREVLAIERERGAQRAVVDWAFVQGRTSGFDAWRASIEAADPAEIECQSGVGRAELRALAERYVAAERVIACWAMGLTQHRHGVANIQSIVNLLLLRGNIGRPGAGVCPVRGHSNVQGDRTMGIWERPRPEFLDRLGAAFGFEPPREHGLDTVAAIEAMLDGRVDVFAAMGGNFAVAAPDSERTERALARCGLAVHIATTLNRTQLVAGEESILLPCLARSERDEQPGGPQFVTVENSMSVVHRSQGRRAPAGAALRSEPRIVADLGAAVFGDIPPGDAQRSGGIDWRALADDYDRIRDAIERVVPGFEDFNRRVREGGFVLPSGARRQEFDTPDGRAQFRVHALPRLDVAPGELLMMTVRSHDQFNTTIYSDDDRYRGIYGSRRVVMLHDDDLAERGLAEGDVVDLVSRFAGVERRARGFRVVRYAVPRGCAATYFPEANGLVALESFAEGSRTPAYKSVPIVLERSALGVA
ncbi:MAG: FdhF/YdeP family oxidoreductase [Myxococcota bacterium]